MQRLSQCLAACYIVFLVFLSLSKDISIFPSAYAFVESILGDNRNVHFILASLLFLSFYLLLPRKITQVGYGLALFSVLTLMIAIEEISHYFIPSRAFEIEDFLTGTAGMFLAWFIIRLICLIISEIKASKVSN